APDAKIELKRAHIEQVIGSTRRPVLNDVACQLEVQGGGAVRVTGKGSTQAGGRLDVDMRIWPADLRADGRVALSALPLTLLVPVLPSVPWFEPEKSRIDAQLLIKAESPTRIALDGHAELRGVSLYAERIATVPVQDISISIAGRGHWLPLQRRLEIDSGSFGLGRAKLNGKGAVELASDHYAFDIDAFLPATPCTDAVRSIPAELLGDMALAQWRGTFAGHLRFQTDSRDLDQTQLKVDTIDHCDFQVVPVMADLSRFSRPFTHSVTEPDGTEFEMETGPGTDNWTPIDAMSPYFIYAVLVHEDPGFFGHHGFSQINIRNALVKDLRERRYAVGASTITMQLVKNVFLHREKTLARKIQEVLLTWWTERVMEKRDILELYLNVIEYGPSIYGVRNAARHYWNRLPSELSPAEGAFLATILPNPKHFHTYYEKNAISQSWASNMKLNLKREFERGLIDKDAFDYSLGELEHFHFAREGEAAAPRTIPGAATPLPYQEQTQETFDANTFGAPGRGFD
ncbi:MAG TPA: biosynthetic peptidoglycan transglycosylase, partial [Polyangiales bacterium]